MPSHRSTPGSSTHRRSPHSRPGLQARWRSRSGLIRASTRRHRRRRCAPSSTSKCRSSAVTTVARTSGGAASSSSATTDGPVGVQPARAHRRMQPTQPGLGAGAGRAVSGQQHRRRDPRLGVHRRRGQHPGHDRRRVQRHVPQRPVGLDLGAVLAATPARSPPTARSPHPAPPTPRRSPAAATPPRPPTRARDPATQKGPARARTQPPQPDRADLARRTAPAPGPPHPPPSPPALYPLPQTYKRPPTDPRPRPNQAARSRLITP